MKAALIGLLLLLSGCSRIDVPGAPNRFSALAAEVLVLHDYCKSPAECVKNSVLKTGQFEESSISDWRYTTRTGVFVAIYDVRDPKIADEISNKIALVLSNHCVRISVQADQSRLRIPPDQLMYLCPAGGA
jgi:hypothetical protein